MQILTIKNRLTAVISFLSLLLVAIGVYGLWGMSQSNEGLRTVYEDRFIPSDALAKVNIYTAENLRQLHLMLMHDPRVPESKLHDHPLSFHTDQMAENTRTNDKLLAEYEARKMTPEETALYEEYKAKRTIYQATRKKTLDLIQAGDFGGAMTSLVRETGPAFVANRAAIQKLFEYQLNVAKREHEKSDQTYRATRAISISLIVVGVLLAISIGFMMIRAIMRPLAAAQEVAGKIASGDLTSHIEIKRDDELGKLLTSFDTMENSIQSLIQNIKNATETISTGSQQIAQGNADLSQRTEDQASSLEETASSMEELTSTVRENAENARQANQLASNASDIAVKGGEVVGDVVHTMASISDSSKKIVDIISVIEGIAFQTNILALNAAVEAARAGEQGRGFAVVAGEVRNLAQRSAAAAKEIKALIDDSVNKVDAGSKQVDQAGATMAEIVKAVKRVTDIMAEIAAASKEQSAGIEQVNIAITQMDEVTQQNAALVEEAAAAAEAMKEQAVVLMEAVSSFKLEAGKAASQRAIVEAATHAAAPDTHPVTHPATHHVAHHAPVASVPAGRERRLVKVTDDQEGDWKQF